MVAQQIVRVRDLRPDEMQAILDIEYKCFKDPYPLGLLNHLYSLHPDGFLVAEVNGKIVGYAIAVMRWWRTGHILAIGVDPLYRRRGIGSMLMTSALNRLREKGAREVRLEVRASNRAAQKFYLKLGFVQREMIPAYYADGEPGIVMVYRF
ncbi:MAG: ribosomal protein S18-alanine N-acetyltransferase [Hadesarchaea archaeon]|nr:ribosomal protein S18-alanine N-acetyltransferase [Hadesarchaea archaeon]